MEYSFSKKLERGNSQSDIKGKEAGAMTQEEISITIQHMEEKLSSISSGWEKFLKSELDKRDQEKSKALDDADRWQKKQTFINKHGAKIAAFVFACISSGLAWYGAQIRSEIQAQDRAEEIDQSIESNKANFEKFKNQEFSPVKNDIEDLQLDSVNQTIMIDKGFERLDKTIMKAHPREFPNKESLPSIEPEFEEAANKAAQKKLYYEKFGKLGPDAGK